MCSNSLRKNRNLLKVDVSKRLRNLQEPYSSNVAKNLNRHNLSQREFVNIYKLIYKNVYIWIHRYMCKYLFDF